MVTEPSMSGSSTKKQHSPCPVEGEQNPLTDAKMLLSLPLLRASSSTYHSLLLNDQLLRRGLRTILSRIVIEPTLA